MEPILDFDHLNSPFYIQMVGDDDPAVTLCNDVCISSWPPPWLSEKVNPLDIKGIPNVLIELVWECDFEISFFKRNLLGRLV
jgi:hypothetical protein